MPTSHLFTLLSPDQRAATANAAAAALEDERCALPRVLVGFDGFVDVLLHAVEQRRTMRPDDVTPFAGIAAFADRIARAAGRSANIELIPRGERYGGNGPLLASALATLGAPTTYIGCVGADPSPDGAQVHPTFAPFAALCERVITLGPPALTHALEFADGKIMCNMPAPIQHVTWQSLLAHVGEGTLRGLLTRATLLGVVNWSIMAGVESILEGLRYELPQLPAASRTLMIDLSDPAKRTTQDLARVLRLLQSISAAASPAGLRLVLGLNLSEAELAAGALGRPLPAATHSLQHRCAQLARDIRQELALACVVVHPRQGAAAADNQQSLWIDGPLTSSPVLSTGAGDHFNAGFSYAHAAGLPLELCLATGVGLSGYYVRAAAAPTRAELCTFLRHLPLPDAWAD